MLDEWNVSKFLALLNALLKLTQTQVGPAYLGVNYEGGEFRSVQMLYQHSSHQVQSFEYGTTSQPSQGLVGPLVHSQVRWKQSLDAVQDTLIDQHDIQHIPLH